MITLSGPSLATDRRILRMPQKSDFPAFAAFQRSARAIERGWQMDDLHLHDFWHKQFGHWVMRGFGWFVMERRSDAAALGYAGLVQPADADEPELGWTIWPDDAEGKGYAFEAARAVLRFAYDDLGLATVPAFIARDNTRSATLASRLGAQRVGIVDEQADRPTDIWRHRRAA